MFSSRPTPPQSWHRFWLSHPCQLNLVTSFASPLDLCWFSVQILSNSISLLAFKAQIGLSTQKECKYQVNIQVLMQAASRHNYLETPQNSVPSLIPAMPMQFFTVVAAMMKSRLVSLLIQPLNQVQIPFLFVSFYQILNSLREPRPA